MLKKTQQNAIRRTVAGCAAALAATAFAAVAVGNTPILISQKGKVFSPGHITVRPGAVVRIVNDDRVLHHVYIESTKFEFDSGDQEPGEVAEIRFAKDGTFEVRCDIHPKMLLTVEVR